MTILTAAFDYAQGQGGCKLERIMELDGLFSHLKYGNWKLARVFFFPPEFQKKTSDSLCLSFCAAELEV